MAAAATVFLAYEFWRLLFQSTEMGAVDLKQRYAEVAYLVAGRNPYRESFSAMYPPASYVMLWPFLGWLDIDAARYLWAITTVALLWLLARQTVRLSGADTALQRAFAALLPISMYATGATVGNGQITIHCITALVVALSLSEKRERTWLENALIAALFLFALVKPALTAPFFWIVLLAPAGRVPAVGIVVGYVALTWFAASFQDLDPLQLLAEWYSRAAAGVEWGNARTSLVRFGSAVTTSQAAYMPAHVDICALNNVHGLLTAIGLGQWKSPASALVLAGLGLWVYLHRAVDIWVLAGVVAFVDRFLVYHLWYDDMLILLPMIALLRIVRQESTPPPRRWRAGALLAVTVIFMLAPGGLYLFPPPWNQVYVALQTLLWLVGLMFLLQQARWEQRAFRPAGTGGRVRSAIR